MHSRATDRRSASKCQEKWPDQTLDQALGLPEVLVAVSSLRLSCKRAGKTRTLSRFGIHLENLGSTGLALLSIIFNSSRCFKRRSSKSAKLPSFTTAVAIKAGTSCFNALIAARIRDVMGKWLARCTAPE